MNKMASIYVISMQIFTWLLSTQMIGGTTCPKSCTCFVENKEKTVACASLSQNGRMNEIQLAAVINEISNDTVRLHMMGISVSILGNNIFKKFELLRELSIVTSHVATLNKDTFSGLRNLQALSLSGNKITTLPKGLFRNLTKLEKVDLHSNQITQLEVNTFLETASVKYLNLQGNKLVRIDNGSFGGLPSLETLILRRTSLKNIHEGTFAGLSKLKHLDLSDNKGVQITQGALRHLRELTFLELRNIGQRSDTASGIFNGLNSLTKLDLSFNKLNKIPRLDYAQVLEVLILTQNYDLKHILKESFHDLQTLKEIHLDFCNIGSIHDEAFSGLKNLKILKLDHNQLISISPTILQALKSVSVTLVGNLWLCDCNMYQTKQWLQQTGRKFDIICDSPIELAGRPLQSLSSRELHCRKPEIKNCCLESLIVPQGGNVTINCSASGVPEPLTNFSKSSLSIGELVKPNQTALKLSNIIADKNFSCVAMNVIGFARKHFVIKVIPADCGPDPRMIAVLVTLMVLSTLCLIALLYITKFKHRNKHLTCVDKTRSDKDVLKLMEHTNGACEL